MKLGWTICVPKQQEEESLKVFNVLSTTRVKEAMEATIKAAPHTAKERCPLFCPQFSCQCNVRDSTELKIMKSVDDITNEAMRKLLFEDNLVIEEKPPFNKDEEAAYNFVKENFSYTKDGRPMTAIPFNDKTNQLNNNFPLAKGCLNSSTQRLE